MQPKERNNENDKTKIDMEGEEISLQTLTHNEGIQIGYSDDDIVIVDSIQQFEQVTNAHVRMCGIAICTSGKVRGLMNGREIELVEHEVAAIPANVIITDLMISPDFNLKAIFFTNKILQSFLHEKMSVWNEVMYVQRLHVVSLNEDDLSFYTHFYDMLTLCFERGEAMPFRSEVIQSLVRSGLLALCGALKLQMASTPHLLTVVKSSSSHFQRFLTLLQTAKPRKRGVEYYAKELCISAKYLSAICKRHSGKTANEWIHEGVMEDIVYYVRQTDFSMKQISDMLGFANPSFFGKYVKEHFGMTPLQLRSEK